MKTCNKCSASKAESEFEKGRNVCRKCRNNYSERKEYLINYQKQKRLNSLFVEKAKENRANYSEEENARNREYYQKNKEEINRKRREKRALKK